MIVILACEGDREAARLAEYWTEHDALWITPADLSRIGWSVTFPGAGTLPLINGTRASSERIRGVLVRLGFVTEYDVMHLVPEDRAYAAAEMTAFLSYWLSVLPCSVINRPSASFLLGPSLTQEQWLVRGAALGIPIADVLIDAGERERAPEELEWVTVVGDRAFGVAARARERSLVLAREAGVVLAGFGFDRSSSSRLAAVSCRPPVLRDEVRGALLALLHEGGPS